MRDAGRHAMPRGHDEFVAKLDPKSKPGEWRGRYVPKKKGKAGEKQKKVAAKSALQIAQDAAASSPYA